MGWLVAALLAFALVVVQVAACRQQRATVPKVAGMAGGPFNIDGRRAPRLLVDGLPFPPRPAGGFHAIGGRSFEVGGRDAVTVVWARGEQRLSYTIVAGRDDVPLDQGSLTRNVKVRGESRDLQWLSDGLLAFKRDGRMVVITGSPPSDELRGVMRGLALSV